jgi:hypothetical protein
MKFKVVIMESERGWGQKIDSVKYFEGENAAQEAWDFADNFNKEDMKNYVPDWYMVALDPVRV